MLSRSSERSPFVAQSNGWIMAKLNLIVLICSLMCRPQIGHTQMVAIDRVKSIFSKIEYKAVDVAREIEGICQKTEVVESQTQLACSYPKLLAEFISISTDLNAQLKLGRHQLSPTLAGFAFNYSTAMLLEDSSNQTLKNITVYLQYLGFLRSASAAIALESKSWKVTSFERDRILNVLEAYSISNESLSVVEALASISKKLPSWRSEVFPELDGIDIKRVLKYWTIEILKQPNALEFLIGINDRLDQLPEFKAVQWSYSSIEELKRPVSTDRPFGGYLQFLHFNDFDYRSVRSRQFGNWGTNFLSFLELKRISDIKTIIEKSNFEFIEPFDSRTFVQMDHCQRFNLFLNHYVDLLAKASVLQQNDQGNAPVDESIWQSGKNSNCVSQRDLINQFLSRITVPRLYRDQPDIGDKESRELRSINLMSPFYFVSGLKALLPVKPSYMDSSLDRYRPLLNIFVLSKVLENEFDKLWRTRMGVVPQDGEYAFLVYRNLVKDPKEFHLRVTKILETEAVPNLNQEEMVIAQEIVNYTIENMIRLNFTVRRMVKENK